MREPYTILLKPELRRRIGTVVIGSYSTIAEFMENAVEDRLKKEEPRLAKSKKTSRRKTALRKGRPVSYASSSS
jgi:hypothetical protein